MQSQDVTADFRPIQRVRKRADVLRESFPSVASAIDARRADGLDSGLVADFVALGWLRRDNGELVVTAAAQRASVGRERATH